MGRKIASKSLAVIILVGIETGFTIDPTLHDVLRHSGEFYTWATWHIVDLMEKNSKLTLLVDEVSVRLEDRATAVEPERSIEFGVNHEMHRPFHLRRHVRLVDR